jgi:RNA-directed DNA polymerase
VDFPELTTILPKAVDDSEIALARDRTPSHTGRNGRFAYNTAMLRNLIRAIASDEVLEQAYRWLCERRKDYSHNDDVWEVRYRWTEIQPVLQAELITGRYRFSPLRRINRTDGDLEIWSALDSLVLKAIAIVLTKHLAPQLSEKCCHLAGNGGAKAAVREVLDRLPQNKFVFRTDVKSYYASIDHNILFAQLKERLDDRRLLDLLWQYLRRTVYDDGLYEAVEQGISLGCSLSPLMGALFLDLLDKRMETTGLAYVRFMDDWLVLAPTRWKLRQAVRIVNETLAELKVQQHPDKTFIGRTERGFAFLGYQMNAAGLVGVAPPTVGRFVERVNRLYERGASARCIGEYVRRWCRWVVSGLRDWVMTLRWPVCVCDAIRKLTFQPLPPTTS